MTVELKEGEKREWQPTSSKSILVWCEMHDNERSWRVRFSYLGWEHLLSLGINWRAPAVGLCLLGCRVWFGRIPPKPTKSMPTEIKVGD